MGGIYELGLTAPTTIAVRRTTTKTLCMVTTTGKEQQQQCIINNNINQFFSMSRNLIDKKRFNQSPLLPKRLMDESIAAGQPTISIEQISLYNM